MSTWPTALAAWIARIARGVVAGVGFVFVFLIWGRWRYDLVAFAALMVAVVAGVIPVEQAFFGFGHPAAIVNERGPRFFGGLTLCLQFFWSGVIAIGVTAFQ